jgi:hypothetical protein
LTSVVSLTTYDPKLIRKVILNCGIAYTERLTEPNETKLRFYYTADNRIVELKMKEEYVEEEIRLLCPVIGITLERFKELYENAGN